jgi:hypothetical protein
MIHNPPAPKPTARQRAQRTWIDHRLVIVVAAWAAALSAAIGEPIGGVALTASTAIVAFFVGRAR